MSAPTVAYPIDDMRAAAAKIRQILDDQWNAHLGMFGDDNSGYLGLTESIARLMPGGQQGANAAVLVKWHQALRKQYDALYSLADQLEQGAGTMESTDTSTAAPGFTPVS